MSLFERLYARALRAEDAVAAMKRISRDPRLPRNLRERLAGASSIDGLRMSALLIARLRFERLLNGSDSAAEWFERDPAEFARVFKRYHRTVAPTAFFPRAEVRLFERWLSAERPRETAPARSRSARGRRLRAAPSR